MPILLGFFAIFIPRLLILVLWFFTGWLRGVFDTMLWPVLGFIFLPTTLLWYAAVQHWFGGQWTFWPIVGLVLALILDVGQGRGRRKPEPPRYSRLTYAH